MTTALDTQIGGVHYDIDYMPTEAVIAAIRAAGITAK